MKIVAVVGPSGSGKTSLIEKLVVELKRRGLSAAVIKHCSRGFSLDHQGKDSWRFREAGSDGVGLVSPEETAVIKRTRGEADDVQLASSYFTDTDFVLIEGRRTVEHVLKIELLRKGMAEKVTTPVAELAAVVSDFEIRIPPRPVFHYRQVHEIADFLTKQPDIGRGGREFEKTFFAKRDLKVLSILQKSTVGIAGAGGLGSNAAVSLARAGLGTLIIADFDRVEPSDLNRQYYFREQVGKLKVEALLENLKRISANSQYVVHPAKIGPGNVAEIFGAADILVEAFDRAEMKQMLIDAWLSLFPGKPIIVASGLAGIGKNKRLHTRKMGNLYVCGDEETECKEYVSPMAPRVGIVANMQANLALELLVKLKGKKSKMRSGRTGHD
ncbi:MAG: sulfur carrier protein ThiS adenylyltransferase ThiF [Candidatus Aminicenantes bacterium]|nr:sulfur carrier protein ThiS adenylyltransferase ThiF [Candidatus Aminicenantes bacterium]